MRLSFLNIFFVFAVLLSCSLLVSCDKVNITYGNIGQSGDPNAPGDPSITYYQNYQVSLQTMQVDSFITSGQKIFTVGYTNDPEFGTIHASSYLELQLPATNPLLNLTNVTFDSLELIVKSKANYYGDTARPFYFQVYRLNQLIQNNIASDNNYSNIDNFGYDPTPITYEPNKPIIDSPGIGSRKYVRISDSLGEELMNKLITDDYYIKSQANFLEYFQGLYIDVDTTTSTNTIYAFSDSITMRLYYDQHALATTQHYLDFPYLSIKQFNHIAYNRQGTTPPFPAFSNNVALLSSTATNDKAYLNSSTGEFIKITLPDLINLKALHPFVQVVSAQLIVTPTPGTYIYPYKLLPSMGLYETSNTNIIYGSAPSLSGQAQNGDLFIDNLYGISTQYTYDITNFVGSILNPPVNPSASTPNALILAPTGVLGDQTLSRLIINDQNLIRGIQLKLYVLGI